MPRPRTPMLLLFVITVIAASLSASESIGNGSQQVRWKISMHAWFCRQLLASMRACSMLVVLCLLFFRIWKDLYAILSHLFGRDKQVYIVYLGHLPASTDASESEGFTAIEFAHHDMLNQVLDDGRSKKLSFLAIQTSAFRPCLVPKFLAKWAL